MKQDPWLLQILRSQLPRPILADALVRSTSYARTPHLAEGRFESLLKAPSLLEDIEKKGLLQCLRPACNKMPTKQCPECGLCYCTLRCEKQHRKKHKLICVAARSGTTKLIPLDIVFVQVRRCSRWERICYYALSNKLSISLVLGILMFCYIYFA
ncbi:hypothetical protein PLICRDRAFT_193971 [Plicaturopsis crispa FD-325 SS-3]|nr:hypothetical protein PLICRDRAFT_193971 [Plicaturopsis crispa FD-325 SS-3]